MNEPRPTMLTYAQVAALTNRSVSTVEKWVKHKEIPFHRYGRNVRFDPIEVRQWLMENDLDENSRITIPRPLKRPPGAQYVFPKDVLGDEYHCWCGLETGHDWPGKDTGAPHPHEHERMQTVVVVEQTEPNENRIEKNALRGYHATLKSFIVKCINVDGLSWRAQKNAILLYPPDGTQPIAVHCRNSDSQMRSLNQWYAAHVQTKPDEPTEGVTDTAAIARLAEAVNDPVEHPFREPEPEPEWTPHVETSGETSEFYETDGRTVRCKVCVGTDSAYETPITRITGLGGHVRMHHTDISTLHGPEARAKSNDSRRYNRLYEKVRAAVELLAETVDYAPDTARVAELEGEIDRLQHALEKEKQARADAEARLQLLNEAFRGLG